MRAVREVQCGLPWYPDTNLCTSTDVQAASPNISSCASSISSGDRNDFIALSSSANFPDPVGALGCPGAEMRGWQAIERAFEGHALGVGGLKRVGFIDHVSAVKLRA